MQGGAGGRFVNVFKELGESDDQTHGRQDMCNPRPWVAKRRGWLEDVPRESWRILLTQRVGWTDGGQQRGTPSCVGVHARDEDTSGS